MERLVDWIDSLKQLELTAEIRNLVEVSGVDLELLGVALLYAFALAWLVSRLWTRRRQAPRRSPDGEAAAESLLRFLGTLALLAVAILLALARAAGRPMYHRW